MRVIVVASLTLVAAACGGSDNGTPTTPVVTNTTVDVVTIQEQFVQPSVSIAPGDTVRWTFQKSSTDGLGHNIRFNPRITGSPADIGSQGNPLTSGTQSRVFSTKGDFHYVCDLHGAMVGEVVVQ
jgi:plastocyanin